MSKMKTKIIDISEYSEQLKHILNHYLANLGIVNERIICFVIDRADQYVECMIDDALTMVAKWTNSPSDCSAAKMIYRNMVSGVKVDHVLANILKDKEYDDLISDIALAIDPIWCIVNSEAVDNINDFEWEQWDIQRRYDTVYIIPEGDYRINHYMKCIHKG